jgi:hypothetical protein
VRGGRLTENVGIFEWFDEMGLASLSSMTPHAAKRIAHGHSRDGEAGARYRLIFDFRRRRLRSDTRLVHRLSLMLVPPKAPLECPETGNSCGAPALSSVARTAFRAQRGTSRAVRPKSEVTRTRPL